MNQENTEQTKKEEPPQSTEETSINPPEQKQPEHEETVFLDDVPISTEAAKAIKQMIWINTSVTWIALTAITVTLVISLLYKIAYQAIAFMLIGAFSSIYWYKWNNRIQEFIR